jgi:hypothetical protein
MKYYKYDLQARYDARQSFYGKARVYEMDNGAKVLESYSTIVAVIEKGDLFLRGRYSQTTTRHIREFMSQNGFYHNTTKEMQQYMTEKETIFNKYKRLIFEGVER